MKRGRFCRTAALGLFSVFATIMNTGCIDTIAQNILVGFGFSLGALPAQFVADTFLAGFFPSSTAP